MNLFTQTLNVGDVVTCYTPDKYTKSGDLYSVVQKNIDMWCSYTDLHYDILVENLYTGKQVYSHSFRFSTTDNPNPTINPASLKTAGVSLKSILDRYERLFPYLKLH